MKLSEVQKQMRPAAEAALAKGLNYYQAQAGFLLTLTLVALEHTDGNQEAAAELMGVSGKHVSSILAGRVPGTRRKNCGKRRWADRHDRSPAEVLGEMQL